MRVNSLCFGVPFCGLPQAEHCPRPSRSWFQPSNTSIPKIRNGLYFLESPYCSKKRGSIRYSPDVLSNQIMQVLLAGLNVALPVLLYFPFFVQERCMLC